MVNSTAVGGGVAEILNRLVPLALDLDIRIRWDVMDGGPDFFRVTKAFHNALHGDPYRTEPDDFEVFQSYTERNRRGLSLDGEFVVIHDPQPAGLIDARVGRAGHWIWRCHIDLSRPNPDRLAIPRDLCLALRRRDLLVTGVRSPAPPSAVSLLSIDRSARRQESTARR